MFLRLLRSRHLRTSLGALTFIGVSVPVYCAINQNPTPQQQINDGTQMTSHIPLSSHNASSVPSGDNSSVISVSIGQNTASKLMKQEICRSTQIPQGHIFNASLSAQDGTQWPLTIVRYKGKLYAVGGKCTYSAVPSLIDDSNQSQKIDPSQDNSFINTVCFNDKLYCSEHGCAYDIQSGNVQFGPARLNLPRFFVEQKLGRVIVHYPSKIPKSVEPKMQFRDYSDTRKVTIVSGDDQAAMGCIEGLRQYGYGGEINVVSKGQLGNGNPMPIDVRKAHTAVLDKRDIDRFQLAHQQTSQHSQPINQNSQSLNSSLDQSNNNPNKSQQPINSKSENDIKQQLNDTKNKQSSNNYSISYRISDRITKLLASHLQFRPQSWFLQQGIDFFPVPSNSQFRIINKKYYPFIAFLDGTKLEYDVLLLTPKPTGAPHPWLKLLSPITVLSKDSTQLPPNVFNPLYNVPEMVRLNKYLISKAENITIIDKEIKSKKKVKGSANNSWFRKIIGKKGENSDGGNIIQKGRNNNNHNTNANPLNVLVVGLTPQSLQFIDALIKKYPIVSQNDSNINNSSNDNNSIIASTNSNSSKMTTKITLIDTQSQNRMTSQWSKQIVGRLLQQYVKKGVQVYLKVEQADVQIKGDHIVVGLGSGVNENRGIEEVGGVGGVGGRMMGLGGMGMGLGERGQQPNEKIDSSDYNQSDNNNFNNLTQNQNNAKKIDKVQVINYVTQYLSQNDQSYRTNSNVIKQTNKNNNNNNNKQINNTNNNNGQLEQTITIKADCAVIFPTDIKVETVRDEKGNSIRKYSYIIFVLLLFLYMYYNSYLPTNPLSTQSSMRKQSKFTQFEMSPSGHIKADPMTRTDNKRVFVAGGGGGVEFWLTRRNLISMNPTAAYQQGLCTAWNMLALIGAPNLPYDSISLIGSLSEWDYLAIMTWQGRISYVVGSKNRHRDMMVIRQAIRIGCMPRIADINSGKWTMNRLEQLIRHLNRSGCYRDPIHKVQDRQFKGEVYWMQRDGGSGFTNDKPLNQNQ